MQTEQTTQAPSTTPTAESSGAATQAASTTPSPQAAAPASNTNASDVTQQVSQENVAPPYSPDFKFKAYEKEYEIEEMFRGLIKDKETEEKVKKFHERAFGFDGLKEKHNGLRSEFQSVQEKYQNIDSNLKQLSEFVKAGDMGSFFETLNIPKEMIFQYVKSELEKQSAPPDQRAQMEEFERIRRENMQLKRQNEYAMSQAESESLQTRVFELDTALTRAEIAPIAQALDAKLGQGAFKRAVIERGILAHKMTGKIIPVEQAVQEAVANWSPFLQGQAQPGAPGQMAPTTPPNQAAKPPTMPNVSGRSTSPIKSGVRSIEDLTKIANAMAANQ